MAPVSSPVRVHIEADTATLERQLLEARALLAGTSRCPTCRHRERRILEREVRVKRSRAAWRFRLLMLVLLVVLAVVSWRAVGSPAAFVALQEGIR
jgi:cytochrome c-type biogenesis protein CcmH/NrfG